jgi:hypothetical protein
MYQSGFLYNLFNNNILLLFFASPLSIILHNNILKSSNNESNALPNNFVTFPLARITAEPVLLYSLQFSTFRIVIVFTSTDLNGTTENHK